MEMSNTCVRVFPKNNRLNRTMVKDSGDGFMATINMQQRNENNIWVQYTIFSNVCFSMLLQINRRFEE